MWCKSCRQDVPGIASLDEGAFHCARCGARVGRRRSSLVDAALAQDICDQGIELTDEVPLETSPTEALYQWAEDESLENVRRALRPFSTGEASIAMKPETLEERFRFDPPASQSLRVPLPETALQAMAHLGPNSPNLRFQVPPQRVAPVNFVPPQRSAATSIFASFAWCVVSFGLMGVVCGSVLGGWALATAREELWKVGLPTALSGLGVLVVGLLFVTLAKLSAQNQSNARNNTATLPVGYALPSYPQSSRFMSNGEHASPAVLDELRNQLDRLTAQMAASNSVSRQSW